MCSTRLSSAGLGTFFQFPLECLIFIYILFLLFHYHCFYYKGSCILQLDYAGEPLKSITYNTKVFIRTNLGRKNSCPVFIIVNVCDVLEVEGLESSAIVHLRFDWQVEVCVGQPGEFDGCPGGPDRFLPSLLQKNEATDSLDILDQCKTYFGFLCLFPPLSLPRLLAGLLQL